MHSQQTFLKKVWEHPFTLILVISCLIYLPALYFAPFVYDDDFHVFSNFDVNRADSLEGFFYFIKNSLTPIPFLVWKAIAYTFGNQQTWAFRLFNIIIHSLNGYLILKLSLTFWNKLNDDKLKEYGNAYQFACLTTAIYLIHPTQVESVIWISSLRGLLATSFSLLSLRYFFKLDNFGDDEKVVEGKSGASFLSLTFFFILGLLCKPTIAPIIIFGILLLSNIKKKLDKVTIGLLGNLVLAALFLSFIHTSDVFSQYLKNMPFSLKSQLFLSSLSTYLVNLLLPFRLNFDYQINPFVISYLLETKQTGALFIISTLFMGLCLSCLVIKKHRTLGVLFLSILILLSPHVGIVNHDFHNISVVADRYLNLVLLPFSWLGALFLIKVTNWSKQRFQRIPAQSVTFFIIISLFFISLFQVRRWGEPERFLLSSDQYMELRPAILNGIASSYLRKGNYEMAKKALRRSINNAENPSTAIGLLIDIYQEAPSSVDREFILERINSSKYQPPLSHLLPLSKLYLEEGDIVKAEKYIQRSISETYNVEQAYSLLVDIKDYSKNFLTNQFRILEDYSFQKGQFDKAIFYLNEQIKLSPKSSELKERLKTYKKK